MYKRTVLLALSMLLVFSLPAKAENKIGIEEGFSVPPSLMLHAHSANFLPEFLDLIEKEGYVTTTYDDFNRMANTGCFVSQKLIIISIDDYGPYLISNTLKIMTEELRQRGMVAVLGLLTENLYQESWDYLKQLEEEGFEIASHTSTHEYLPGLSNENLSYEVVNSYNAISSNIAGPVSLILPYGGYANDQRINTVSKAAGYSFIVGIGGGEKTLGNGIYYVGRESPILDSAERTLKNLERRFDTKYLVSCQTFHSKPIQRFRK